MILSSSILKIWSSTFPRSSAVVLESIKCFLSSSIDNWFNFIVFPFRMRDECPSLEVGLKYERKTNFVEIEPISRERFHVGYLMPTVLADTQVERLVFV